jgi:hypothetical protein
MAPNVFVSFDWDNDRHYKFLLEAWHANPLFTFSFTDGTSSEINTNDVGRIKAALTAKINAATYTLVLVGKEANKRHRLSAEIGFKNWINFEVNRSKLARNRLVAVKLDRMNESPEELLGADATWAMGFSEQAIISALRGATASNAR